MCGFIAASMSLSVGRGVLASRAAAAIICPDWQYPHCGTSSSIHAACRVFMRAGERPSIVVTFLFAAAAMVSLHDRTGSPSTCTAHAEHCPMPHPYLVPVSPSVSRSTHSSGVSGLASTVSVFPLTESEKEAMSRLFEIDQ
jgi:hypothetical protein